MNDNLLAAAKLLAYAIVYATAGFLLSGHLIGLLVGAPVALAAILRGFGVRDPGDFF